MTMGGVDQTFHAIVAGFEEPLRTYARTLPHRIGIVEEPHGRWEDFWILDPSRNAPVYAAEGASVEALLVDPQTLERYREAHHAAVVFGLLADRIADEQVEADERLSDLLGRFYQAWRALLSDACGDTALADEAIGSSMEFWGTVPGRAI